MVNARAGMPLAMALLAMLGVAVPAVGSTPFPIGNTANDESTADAVFDGTNFLVSYQERVAPGTTNVGAKLVSPSGQVLATPVAAGTVGDPPVIGYGGGQYLVAWTDHTNGPSTPVRGMLVTTTGTAGSPFTISQSNTTAQAYGIAFDGTNYLVLWVDQTGPGTEAVEVRLVSTAGVPQGTDLIVAAGANNPALAFAAGTYLASWDDQSSQTVSARLIAPNGTLGAPFTISSDPAPSDDPGRIGTDGTSFLVMWTEEVDVPSNNWDLYAQRVSAAGALVGGAIPLTTAPGQQILPCVAFDGTNYLVTWTDLSGDTNHDFQCDAGEALCVNVQGQFVGAAGNLVGENMLLTPDVGFQGLSPTAYGAGTYLVVWGDGVPGTSGDIVGEFLPPGFVYQDGFESDTLLGWSVMATDGGDLDTNATAPLDGAFDLQAVVNDTNSLYVEDHTPLNENHYRARFLIDPTGFDPGEAQSHFRTRTFLVFEDAPLRRLAAIVLKRQGSQYSLEGRARLDSNAFADTGFFDLTSAPHAIELEWKRATAPASGDGEFRLWIDGTLRSEMTNVQNNRSSVDFVRLGALSLKGGASGVLHWDDFASGRETYIGP